MIYKALIRSVIDYGCIAYNNASLTLKNKLDRIQSECLRISCGAMKSTSIAALQVECGEQPLDLRREQQQLQYAIKINAIKDHETAIILKPDRRKMKRGKTSFAHQTSNFITDLDISHEIYGPEISPIPPWHFKETNITYDLYKTINKEMAPEIIQQAALCMINNFTNHIKIFTDGSKDNLGRVGSAVYISDFEVGLTFRLPNGLSVYTSELVAIREALRFIKDNKIQNSIILSDSLSTLQSLETGRSLSRPNLLIETQALLLDIENEKIEVCFAWVPSHVGIRGNEEADKLAKLATLKPKPDLNEKFELKEAYSLVDDHILKKWQMKWFSEPTGRDYFEVERSVSHKIKFSCKERDKETTITRFRLGKCYLNSYLHQIGKHPTGLCNTCHVPETVKHYILECRQNKTLLQDLQKIRLNNACSIDCILSDKKSISVLYDFIKSQNRRI